MFSAGGLGVASTTNPGTSSPFVQTYHPDRWLRTRNTTLELILGLWSSTMHFRHLHLNIEKVNPRRHLKWWSGFPSPVHILNSQNKHSRVALILILNPPWFELSSSISSFPCLLHRHKTNPSSAIFTPEKPIESRSWWYLPRELATSSSLGSLFCFVFVDNLNPDETF